MVCQNSISVLVRNGRLVGEGVLVTVAPVVVVWLFVAGLPIVIVLPIMIMLLLDAVVVVVVLHSAVLKDQVCWLIDSIVRLFWFV